MDDKDMTREDMIDEAVRQYMAYLQVRWKFHAITPYEWAREAIEINWLDLSDRVAIRFNFWRIAMEEEWSKT
jgi:hypothetical protein